MDDLSGVDFFSEDNLKDPFAFYDRARIEQPVFRASLPGFESTVFVVTSYDLAREAFADTDRFSSDFLEILIQGAEPHPEADALFEQGVKQGSLLLTLDEPEHKRYRALATQVFTPRQAASLAPVMEAIMDDLIDQVIETGECDFVESIAVPYPIYVIADLLGYERTIYKRLRRWSDAFLIRLSQKQTKAEDLQAVRDILEFQAFNRAMIEDRRTHPRDDLITHILQARVAGVEPLTDREALVLTQEVAVAGNETSRNTLIGGMALVLRQPGLLQRLRDKPALIPAAVEEMLRLLAPTTGMWRVVKRDVELGGVEIPSGSVVMLRMDAANRDPRRFPDPEKLDVERRNRAEHLSFGHGAHYCIGNMLARRELTIAFRKIVERMPNARIVEEKSDLGSIVSVLHRSTKALHIAFDKGRRVGRDAA